MMRLLRTLGCALALALLASCTDGREPSEPPLRPLLYTESPHEGVAPPAGLEAWGVGAGDPAAWPSRHRTRVLRAEAPTGAAEEAETPEALAQSVLEALLANAPERLEPLLFTSGMLRESARMTAAGAEREAARIREETLTLLARYAPARGADGLELATGTLRVGQVTLGRPRQIDGSLATEEDEAVLYWGSEVTFHESELGVQFTLRLPRILRGTDGAWRLQQAPEPDWKYVVYRDIGLDRPASMMTGGQAPWPLATGNFWHYRTLRPSAEDELTGGLTDEGFRDEVVEVVDHGRWRLVRLVRYPDRQTRTPERFGYLQTPTRVYLCPRDCQRQVDNPEFVLAFARHQVPLAVFPLRAGASWGAGGVSGRSDATRVAPDRTVLEVPAGTFHDAFELVHVRQRTRETRYFVRGVGVAARRTASPGATVIEELVNWRVLQ